MSVMSGLHHVFKGFFFNSPLAPFLMAELAVESAILPETSAVHFPAIDFAEAELSLATAYYYHQMQNSD
jgi:hypothetical protein